MLAPSLLAVAIFAIFVASWGVKASLPRKGALPKQPPAAAPRHIVSMAPSVTEMLFALDLGDRVVGVTRYCDYPEEAARLPRVGGHLDPNLEAIVRLRPDLVVVLDQQQELTHALQQLTVRTVSVGDNSVERILEAIERLGVECRATEAAEELIGELRARMAAVRQRSAGLSRPSVLVVIDRSLDAGTIEDVYIAGRDAYFEQLIEMAGGRNAYRGPAVPYPVVSVEGIIRIAPEVIIDLAAGRDPDRAEQAMADWQRFPQIDAVARNRLYAITADYAMIPGPRFVLLLEALAGRIHPR